MPEETKRKISEAQKGKPKSAEARLKMSLAARRRCQSASYLQELSERMQKQWSDPVQRTAFVAATRNKRMSAHSRALISAASKSLWSRPGFIEQFVARNRALPRTAQWRRRISEAQRGSRGNNWQGGKTRLKKRLQNSVEWKLWREAVFKRDNWTCRMCGVRGGVLHPDHIKPFAYFASLRFDVDNGRTLCVPCHKLTPTYGHGAKRYKTQEAA